MSRPTVRGIALGAAILGTVVFATVGAAALPDSPELSNVANANLKSVGYAPAPKLSKELQEVVWAQGGTRLENPSGIVTDYGFENDISSSDDSSHPQMIPVPTNNNEAQKTEPDKNTYLVFKDGLKGPDASYDYGTHFVFQGHEIAATVNGKKQSYITRVNLDADAQHRVTLLATQDTTGQPIFTIDGSTWEPWAKRLLFTTETATAPTYAATPDFPSTVEDVPGRSAGAATRASRTTPTGTSGSSRTSAARTSPEPSPRGCRTASSIGTSRRRRVICTTASCRCCRCSTRPVRRSRRHPSPW